MASVMQRGVGPGTAGSAQTGGRHGMEAFINVGAFVIFAALWIAFGAALIWSQGSLDQAWEWMQSLPIVLQAVVALLLLPVVAGLWVWETSWPLLGRLVVVGGLALTNLVVFFPRTLFGGRP